MWELLAQYLGSGAATEQAGSMAGNLAAGAQNSGWLNMAKDLQAGNYASAAGNALEMGRQTPDAPLHQAQPATPLQIPQYQGQPQPYQAPVIMPAQQQSPYVQQMMQRYLPR